MIMNTKAKKGDVLSDAEIIELTDEYLNRVHGPNLDPQVRERVMRAFLDHSGTPEASEEMHLALLAADPILSNFSEVELDRITKFHMDMRLRDIEREQKRG